MVKKLLSVVFVALATLTAISTTSYGQTGVYPFPQNIDYSYGLKPDNANDAHVQAAYNYWKTNFVTSTGACGERRVIFDYFSGTTRGRTDRSRTVSEGIAYGMLITAYMDDKALFDDLWSYYKIHRNQNGVMHWRIDNCSVSGQNGASDAELDVAMALIVASHQWQNDSYLNDAKNMVRVIRQHEIEGGSNVLKPGDAFGGSNLVCPSYFSPAYYRVFGTLDGEDPNFWNAVANKGYEIINNAAGSTGLVPDWCNAAGNASGDAGGYEDNGRNFIFDAIRTPFRSGIDFLWHGNADAKAYCEKLSTWLIGAHGSPTQIGSKYGTRISQGASDGQKLNNDHNNTFVGCFAVGLMGTELTGQQNYLNQIYSENVNVNPNYGEYFNASFKILSLLVMTGNFYLPPPDQCSSPELGDNRSLCEGSPVQLNATITPADGLNRSYVWRRNGNTINGATSQTYNATQAGLYEVIATTTGDGCVRRDKVEVFNAAIDADFQATPGPGSIFLTNTSTGGISDYLWTIEGPGGPYTFTEENPVPSSLANGSYEVTLEINNSGFSCAATDQITKTVIVGDGEGVAIDDFNDLYNGGINLYTYGPDGDEFEPFPVTYCSRQDEIDGKPQDCPDNRCSYVDLVCTGSSANWASMEFEFFGPDYPLDLDGAAFVSVKMSATTPVQVGWRLGKTNADGGFLSTPILIDLTTDEQVFTMDFNAILAGDVDGTPSTITDWDGVTKLTLRPYLDGLTYTGTISIDWVIIGSKSLSPPVVDVRKDEFGYVDYSNYLPDYYPNDPTYASCTPADVSGLCYGSVPDWEREVGICEGSDTTLVMNACTADQINWYKAGILVGQGDTYTATDAGKYIVELINQGGITYDSVNVVVSETPEVDFITSIEDDGFGLRVVPSFTNTDDWEWDFDVTDLQLSEGVAAKGWEESYNNYSVDNGGPGEGTYNVCLTAYNTACNLSATECKSIEITCFAPLGAIDLSSTPNAIVESGDVDTIYTCSDLELTISTPDVTNAGSYGWFGSIALPSTTTELVRTFTASEQVKIEAYNACGEKVADSVYVKVEEDPIANFTATNMGGLQYSFQADWVGASGTYEWDFDDDGITDDTGIYVEYTFPSGGVYPVALTITNDCGTDTYSEDVGCELPDISSAAIVGPTTLCDGEGCQTYTITGATGATGYTWAVPAGASSCGETANEIDIDFDGTTGGTISVTANNACASSTPVTLPVVVNPIPAISAATATPSTVCVGESASFSVTGSASYTYTWTGPNAYSSASQNATLAAATIASAGTYSVTAEENGCTSAAVTTTLAVNQVPGQAIPTATPSSACEGENIQLNASAVTGATYSWTGPNSYTSGIQNPMLSTVSSADAGDYCVTTTANGCSSAPNCVTVTVNPGATLSGITGLTTVDCATTEAYGVSPVNPSSSYVWTLPDNSTRNGAGINIDWGANGGVLSVEETTSGGCTASTQVSISVNACPFPTPDFTADKTSGCGSLTVNFTDASASVDGADTYSWDFDGDNVEDDNTIGNVSHTYATPGTYTASLTITDDFDGKTYKKSVTINVYEIPVLSGITSDFEVCEGEPINLSVSTTLGTVAWTGPSYTGAGATVAVTASAISGNDGIYSAIATSNGCASTPATVDVTVNPAAAVGGISGPTAVDCGNTESYTVLPSVNPTSSYVWTLPNTTTQNGAPTAITWDETNGILSVEETTADGCVGQASTTITITPCPNPTPNFSADVTSACGSATVNFTDLSSAVGAGDTYAWDFGDGSPIDNTVGNVSHTYSVPGTYSVTLTITDVSAGNTTFPITKTDYIVVNEVPAALTISGSTTADCETQETYTVTGQAGSSYVWDVTGMPTGTSGSSTTSSIMLDFAAATSGSGSITVIETSSAGCVGPMATLDINVNCSNFQAVISTPATNTTICAGETVNFTGTITGTPQGTATYAWDFDGGATNSAVQNPGTITFATPGVYDVTLTVTDDLESDVDNVTVTVLDNTVGAAGSITGSLSVCDNQSGVTYSIAPVSGADTYTWSVTGDATIVSGNGTTSIKVDFGTQLSDVSVTPSSTTCGGSGTPNSVSVDVGAGTIVPVVDINGDGSTCDGSVNFEINVSGILSTEVTSISWFVGGVLQPAANNSFQFTNGGNKFSGGEEVSVEITTDNECASPNTATDMVTITIKPAVDDPVISGTNVINDCPSVGLETFSIDPIAGGIYNWVVQGGTITDATGTPIADLEPRPTPTNQIYVDFSATTNATYARVNVAVIIPNCGTNNQVQSDPLYVNLCTPTPVSGELNGAELNVYPNPFSQTSNIKVTSDSQESYDLVIYNAVSGLPVYEGSHTTGDVVEVGQDWTSGLYIGQAVFDGGVITFKLEKSR